MFQSYQIQFHTFLCLTLLFNNFSLYRCCLSLSLPLFAVFYQFVWRSLFIFIYAPLAAHLFAAPHPAPRRLCKFLHNPRAKFLNEINSFSYFAFDKRGPDCGPKQMLQLPVPLTLSVSLIVSFSLSLIAHAFWGCCHTSHLDSNSNIFAILSQYVCVCVWM